MSISDPWPSAEEGRRRLLIADAAPEMYKALKEILKSNSVHSYMLAVDAIAKAEGVDHTTAPASEDKTQRDANGK